MFPDISKTGDETKTFLVLTVVCNSMVLVIHDQKGVYNEEENEKITIVESGW